MIIIIEVAYMLFLLLKYLNTHCKFHTIVQCTAMDSHSKSDHHTCCNVHHSGRVEHHKPRLVETTEMCVYECCQ